MFAVEAIAGGVIDLPGVTTVAEGRISVSADGEDSRLDVPLLTAINATHGASVMEVRNQGAMAFDSGVDVSGVDIVVGSASLISAETLRVLQNSILRGNGTLDANVINEGIVRPGASIGMLTILGDYTQRDSGRLELEIGGSIPVAEHDVLTVSGVVDLGGTVRLTRTNNFSPQEGHSFRVATFAGRSTQQPAYEGLDFGGDAELSPELSYGDLTFIVGFSSGPRVVDLVPVDTVLDPGGGPYFDVVFDEPVDPATFTTDDAILLGPDGQPATFFAPEPLLDAIPVGGRFAVGRRRFVRPLGHRDTSFAI